MQSVSKRFDRLLYRTSAIKLNASPLLHCFVRTELRNRIYASPASWCSEIANFKCLKCIKRCLYISVQSSYFIRGTTCLNYSSIPYLIKGFFLDMSLITIYSYATSSLLLSNSTRFNFAGLPGYRVSRIQFGSGFEKTSDRSSLEFTNLNNFI